MIQFGVHGIKGSLVDGELEKYKEFGKKFASHLKKKVLLISETIK